MDAGRAERRDGEAQEAGREPWALEGPRLWRPRITAHAILRYAQRVKGIELVDESDLVGWLKLHREDIHREIWPDHMRLPRDPRCAFAMLRGGFVYPVRSGVLLTVLRGHHYTEPGPMARG